jgi:putative ABC transport system substrate-binding protein
LPVLVAPRWHGRTARAQQTVLGYLSGMSPDDSFNSLADFRRGLAETGYVEGRNLAIEYRWLEGRYDQIPPMLADVVKRRVAVIVPNTTTAALAVKAATRTIPIVFAVGSDPVAVGLVTSLNHPGGNLTAYPSSKLYRPHNGSSCSINSSREKGRSLFLSTGPILLLPRPR